MARILIVEDNDLVRRALKLAVERLGHQANVSGDPIVALEMAREIEPELVLLDIRLPHMSGFELLAALYQALGTRSPAVVFVTATQPAELDARLGAQKYVSVTKPFGLDDLRRAIQSVLRGRYCVLCSVERRDLCASLSGEAHRSRRDSASG